MTRDDEQRVSGMRERVFSIRVCVRLYGDTDRNSTRLDVECIKVYSLNVSNHLHNHKCVTVLVVVSVSPV